MQDGDGQFERDRGVGEGVPVVRVFEADAEPAEEAGWVVGVLVCGALVVFYFHGTLGRFGAIKRCRVARLSPHVAACNKTKRTL